MSTGVARSLGAIVSSAEKRFSRVRKALASVVAGKTVGLSIDDLSGATSDAQFCSTDRLLNNPWAQPPLPSDWEVRPTYRHKTVPYYLAPLWDEEKAQKKKVEQRRKRFHGGKPEDLDPALQVPKEVRARLKRARAAKGLLQDLEEDVRVFVQRWNSKNDERQREGFDDIDSEEDEVVFVGRNGQMHDSPGRRKGFEDLSRQKLVFDALAEDRSASFGCVSFLIISNYSYLHVITSVAGLSILSPPITA